MNGKNSRSINRSLRQIRQVQASKRHGPLIGPYVQIGDWKFQEDENGNLVIINTETEKTYKFDKE